MNISIIGYGRMGHEIEKISIERGHRIIYKIDENNFEDIHKMKIPEVDVAIEFTNPASAYNNVLSCFEAGIPVVSGTTGWNFKLDDLKNKCIRENKSFLYASNFSVGVNVLFALNARLSKIMNRFPEYGATIEETHHMKKLDSPSGTAITLAEGIIQNMDRLNHWAETTIPDGETLGIHSVRRGDVPGIHEIKYDSLFDTIQISHSAKSRQGFALGAVLAAEFIQNKTGFFEMKDVLQLNGD